MNASFASHERCASCKFCVAHALDPTDSALIQEDCLREFEATSSTQGQKYVGNTVDGSLVDIGTFTVRSVLRRRLNLAIQPVHGVSIKIHLRPPIPKNDERGLQRLLHTSNSANS